MKELRVCDIEVNIGLILERLCFFAGTYDALMAWKGSYSLGAVFVCPNPLWYAGINWFFEGFRILAKLQPERSCNDTAFKYRLDELQESELMIQEIRAASAGHRVSLFGDD